MYNVLVVGCGGSGAKTLAFMMDQLKADLRRYGVEEIPQCWQFMAVDTPIQEEDMGRLGVARVSDQGGQYIKCGVASSLGYSAVDASITERLTQGKPFGLRETATWMPRKPTDVTFPVDLGAGQHRGIGRLLVLNRLEDISKGARIALDRMRTPAGQSLVRRVSQDVPGVGSAPAIDSSPLVLMVSSMAGGSGASMTLDVARVIASTPGFNADHITAFLYTADVFSDVQAELSSGMAGNTLAMIGELLGAQISGHGAAAQGDKRLYEHFGLDGGSIGLSVKRVIPIGAKVGGVTGSSAGATSDAIFRSVGRGLARFMSTSAFESFVHYDLANPYAGDNSKFGWGTNPDSISWSSFGYASFSLGRERYLEYAAQRLSRRVTDHALSGHMRADDTRGSELRLKDLWDLHRTRELTELGLPQLEGVTVHQGKSFDESVAVWAEHALGPKATLKKFAHGLVRDVLGELGSLGDGVQAQQWEQLVSQLLSRSAPAMRDSMQVEVMRRSYLWSSGAQDRLVTFTSDATARLGLPYAHHVLDELSKDGGDLERLAGELQKISLQPSREPWVFPEAVSTQIAGMGKKASLSAAGFAELKKDLTSSLETAVYDWLMTHACGPLASTLTDFSANAVIPMKTAVGDATRILNEDKNTTPTVVGVAQVESSFYEQWPADPQDGQPATDCVPARFAVANNEVVLMGTEEYTDRFDAHVLASVAAARDEIPGEDPTSLAQGYQWAMRDVLKGSWRRAATETGAVEDMDTLIEVKQRWEPRGFQLIHPNSSPRAASYELAMRATEVLARARKFVARSNEAFSNFASESIHHYLTDQALSDYDKQSRVRQTLDALQEAVSMARPLSSVNPTIRQQIDSVTPTMHLEFSALPFLGLSQVSQEFPKILKSIGTFDPATLAAAGGAAYTSDEITRVDVFGSDSKTLPIAYSGILSQVREDWHKKRGSVAGRSSFWKWRRSRTLSASLPFGDEERRAMIKGWYLALITGGIQLPGRTAHDDASPVRVWDPEERTWVAFPAPMITAPSQLRIGTEWLPAVLESSLLAFLEAETRGLESFRPYNVLRHYVDRGATGPSQALDMTSDAALVMADFLNKGVSAHSGISNIKDVASLDFEERKAAVIAWLGGFVEYLNRYYLADANHPRGTEEYFTNFTRRNVIEKAPLTVDLAEEICEAAEELLAMTEGIVESTSGGDSQSDGVFGAVEFEG